jgi:ABC-type transport system involved in Fe-S cluster assembly fused permease/ATPase subunit
MDDKSKIDELIEAVVPSSKRAHIHEFLEKKSKGYLEMVGERGLKLSGGEK